MHHAFLELCVLFVLKRLVQAAVTSVVTRGEFWTVQGSSLVMSNAEIQTISISVLASEHPWSFSLGLAW